ncbi:MAG: hypothetical protein ACI9NN_001016 [Bacteroidia bacterium]|jgi:hypothetical protein
MTTYPLFSQIISKIDRKLFKKDVAQVKTDYRNKGFDSWTHLVSMVFCHLAKSTSLRDISNGLLSATGNLNHLGIRKPLLSQALVIKTNIVIVICLRNPIIQCWVI